MYRAMLMVFEGDIDEAVRRLRLSLRRDLATEERAYVVDLLVDALIESGRIDEAREAIERASLPAKPGCAEAWRHSTRFDTPCRLRNRYVSPRSFFTAWRTRHSVRVTTRERKRTCKRIQRNGTEGSMNGSMR
jgi:hypothetical protein